MITVFNDNAELKGRWVVLWLSTVSLGNDKHFDVLGDTLAQFVRYVSDWKSHDRQDS